MILQEREIHILAHLLRYRYMNTIQIKRLFFAHQTTANMNRVLRLLADADLIMRTDKRSKLGSLLYLAPKGAKCLAREWGVDEKEIGFHRITKPIQSLNHFYHRMRMIDFWIRLDIDLQESDLCLKHVAADFQKRPNKNVFEPRTSISSTDGRHKLVPDLCFVLENQTKRTERVFFVEVDTGKETIQGRYYASRPGSLLHKYQTYEQIMRDGGWKTELDTAANAFLILTVTESEQHVQNIIRKCQGKVAYPQLFLFTTHEQVVNQGGVFGEIWERMEKTSNKCRIA